MAEDDPFANTRMSLAQHLDELRKRMIRGVLALFIAWIVAFSYSELTSRWVLWPLESAVAWLNRDLVEDAEQRLKDHPEIARAELFQSDDPADQRLKRAFSDKPQLIDMSEGFFYAFRLSLYAAFALGGPVLLWQMWGFIAAGLYERERKLVMRYFPASLFLFVAGLAAAFFGLVPFGIYFLQQTVPFDMADFRPSLENYLSFLSRTCLWAGLVFQTPLIIQVLIRLELVQASTFARYRKHFIVAAFLISGFVTPSADPYSQVLLAVPMWLLYETGILLGRMSVAKRAKEPAP